MFSALPIASQKIPSRLSLSILLLVPNRPTMPNEQTAAEVAHGRAVREMFSGIAGKYDLLNHLLSINIDKRWRRLVREKLADILANPDAVVLDVACGTG